MIDDDDQSSMHLVISNYFIFYRYIFSIWSREESWERHHAQEYLLIVLQYHDIIDYVCGMWKYYVILYIFEYYNYVNSIISLLNKYIITPKYLDQLQIFSI